MVSGTSKRLVEEFADLTTNPPDGVIVTSDNPRLTWSVLLSGPSGTLYEGGTFKVKIEFPDNYPFKPPKAKFITKIYHPSIKQDSGEICQDIYEKDWVSTKTMKNVINELKKMLVNLNTKEKSTMQPIKRDYFQFKKEREGELKTKVQQESEWPKFLGHLTLEAFVIGTLTRKVDVGDSVLLVREKHTNCKKTQKKQKASANTSFIRVKHGDREIGRLENIFAVTLDSLLDKNYISVDAEVLSPPSNWNHFSPFTLKAKVYLSWEVITKPITKIYSTKEMAQGQEELILAKMKGTREAFITIFELLNLNKITNTLIQRQPKGQPKQKVVSENTSVLSKQNTNTPRDAMNVESDGMNPRSLSVDISQDTNDIDYSKLLNLENLNQDELKPTEAPESFKTSLHNYQKQALTWMLTREGQLTSLTKTYNDKTRQLHALWEEYLLQDNSCLFFNPYTGQLSVEMPKASPDCKGGILADEMGLGKTAMMISLIHAHPFRVKKNLFTEGQDSLAIEEEEEVNEEEEEVNGEDELKVKKIKLNGGFFTKPNSVPNQKIKAGTLIIVPLTLLSEWQSEFEKHSKPGSVSVYLYHDGSRTGSEINLESYDVVITTYGIVRKEFTGNNLKLHSYDWFRIVLDEAHDIKGRTTLTAKAVYELTATHKWCLSGTPVQNKLDDLFSLIHFLKLEPWSDPAWWNKYINKPNKSNDPIVFKILQSILKPILLRRTKKTRQSNGEMLIELPERVQKIEFVQLSLEEKDIYDSLFRKSKTEFDQYVAEGTLLKNYVHMLEILLRLRQTCDHHFLISTRKDFLPKEQMESAIYKFFEKYDNLANESIYPKNPLENIDQPDYTERAINEETHEEEKSEIQRSAKATNPEFVKEQIERLTKGEMESCPVCLSNIEDAVIAVCAHVACRECMNRAIDSTSKCPLCRHELTPRDFMTVPRDNKFAMDIKKKYSRSSKIEALFRHVEEVVGLKEKCIIFSQWLSMLDLLELDLEQNGIKFTRLDGSLSQKKRTEVLHQFKTDPSIAVFLISLKAGGVGLNLTAANHVFLIDPWWNPAVEDQAADRVHRIGQKKNVEIIRFICSHTVEERIIELHQHKKELFDSIISRSQEKKKAYDIENFKYLMQNY